MPNKKYHVKLTADERDALSAITRKQNAAASKVRRAKALLAMDCGEHGEAATDVEAGRKSGFTTRSLERLRARACEVGPLGALERKPRDSPPQEPKVTGEVEAHIVQIACSEAPEGASRWTLKMIAERLVELDIYWRASGLSFFGVHVRFLFPSILRYSIVWNAPFYPLHSAA